MSNLTTLPLAHAVTQIKTGSTPPTSHTEYFGGDIPWFTPGDIGSTKYLIESTRTITQEAISAGEAKLFEKDMLLVTCIGNIGRVGVIQQPSYSNQQITALKFRHDIDSEFAYYWFVSNKQKLVNLANQAIVPILNNERLSEIEFAYPPLTEQKRIASRLARADRLRQLRRVARDLGDDLLQSVFLEMFGDPFNNEKGWERIEIAELIRSGDTINYGVVQPGDDFPNGKPVIRVGDLDNLAKDLTALKLIDPKIEANYKRSRIVGDEILIACVGSIGKIALATEKMKGFNIVRAVARVPANYSLVNRFYLAAYLSMPIIQEFFQRETRTVAQPTLNITQIEETPILMPPLSLQAEFAGVVARVEALRGRMSEAGRQGEGLFESLLSEAFK